MKIGAVLGKHEIISRSEITAQGIIIEKQIGQIILSTLEDPSLKMNALAGIIKRGEVIEINSISETDLMGVSDKELGKRLKEDGKCKRFKIVDITHTDKEIKENGCEYIAIDENSVIRVDYYQNIDLFSQIDFDKPINSMQIGMMPAKLTQILINIGVGSALKNKKESQNNNITIYDPFVGLGTTYMIANSMGYDVIGSDINITPAKQNLPWRNKQESCSQDKRITLFSHDATLSLNKPFLQNTTCVVTEGWLGPIVTNKTRKQEIEVFSKEIEKLYIAWINNMYPLWECMTIVCTIPFHVGNENKHITAFLNHCERKGIYVSTISQVYSRAGQKVGRKIVILKWGK